MVGSGITTVLAAAAIAALSATAQARNLAHALAMDDYPFVQPQDLRLPSPSYRSATFVKRSSNAAGGNSGEDEEVEQSPYGDYTPYGGLDMRQRRAFQRMRREKELKQLYEKIAREFPFVAKQGLKPGQKVPSLDDLFAMTMFGQPNGR